MGLFDYDYDDLARQLQTGLDRLAVSFLRGHRARMRRDLVDFHGNDQVEIELTHDGQTLKVRQARRAPAGVSPSGTSAAEVGEVFESTFNGWPSSDAPREEIARWLESLPAGEAPSETVQPVKDEGNPFAAAASSSPRPQRGQDESFNPFLTERSRPSGSNPFLDTDRAGKRDELLRRLRGDDDERR